jgi:hypothetical protein
MFLVAIIYLAIFVLYLVSFWKIAEKAGRKGWEGIVPIYNMYILLKIGGKPGWWLLLMLIPVVNFIFIIWAINMVSKSFGKDEGFTVGLLLLGFVFWPILGLGDAKYIGPYGDPVAFQAARTPDFDFDKPANA